MNIEAPAAAAVPRRGRARLKRVAWWFSALTVALVLALAGSAAWLLGRSAGNEWLFNELPGVQAEGVSGSLLRQNLRIQRLRIQLGRHQAELQDVRVAGLGWLGARVLHLQELHVQRALVKLAPSTTPPTPPASLRLPLSIDIGKLLIDELQVDTYEAARNVKMRLHLGAEAGELHRFERLSLVWGSLAAAGQGQVGADSPFNLSAQLGLATGSGRPWVAQLNAAGAMALIELQAALRGQALGASAAPALNASARIAPFAAWPLAGLSAPTKDLDLASLHLSAPHSQLTGEVSVRSSGRGQPAQARIDLRNSAAGPGQARRAPLRSLELDLQAPLAKTDQLELKAFNIEFGSAQAAAGRWQGSGQWQGHRLELRSQLSNLHLAALDARAPALTASGPLHAVVNGLPAPDGTASAAPINLVLDATLDGRHRSLAQPFALAVQGEFSASQVLLNRLRASVGAARADLQAQARLRPGGGWAVASTGTLKDFDPLPWLTLAADSPWRRGPHRLQGSWQGELQLPPAPAFTWQAVRGRAQVDLGASLVAGVPVSGHIELAAPDAQSMALQAQLQAAGSRIKLDAAGAPQGEVQLGAELAAPNLAALRPLVALLPQAPTLWPSQGALQAQLQARGTWPQVKGTGTFAVQQLKLGEWALAQGSGQLSLDATGADPAFTLDARAEGAAQGAQRLDQLQARVAGTLARHEWQATLHLPVRPPPAAAALLGMPRPQPAAATPGTRLQATGAGAWAALAEGGGWWRGQVQSIQASPSSRSTPESVNTDWLTVQAVPINARFSAAGSLLRLEAGAGRARLPGGLSLTWQQAYYEPNGDTPRLFAQAQLEAFDATPLLQRAQPELGWSGNLRLRANLEIKAEERFDAELVIERESGDLAIRDGSIAQPLGLSDLRFALSAHDGTWYFTQAFAGGQIGEAAGAIGLKTSPQRRWPEAQAAISGVVQARVANLGAWGTWVPPGWRLGGSLQTSASFGGRFGDPEITGELRGNALSVRNLLEGVDLKDGEVMVTLKGAKARIERFSLRGGAGSLQAEGEADIGAAPQARLTLKAEHFQLLGRVDRRVVASGQAQLNLAREKLQLNGRFKVDEALFDVSAADAPRLDDDVIVRRAAAAADATPAAAPASPWQAQIALDVDLGSNLRVRGRGLDALLRGQLQLSNPGGTLAVRGRVNAEAGTYLAYGQRMQIERGALRFDGPVGNPTLDILALRANLDERVGVAVTGSALYPRVRLYSEPEMSDSDKLSWLLLGRGPDGLGRTDTALLQRAALALLAGEGRSPTDALLRRIGLDELSLRQSDGDVKETIVTLGKQLSQRWYAGYERGINATTGTWQLIYRAAQRFTLRAQSGLENSLDVIWTWKFD